MSKVHAHLDVPGTYKKAPADLLQQTYYHLTAPAEHNQMLRREYARILNRGIN